MTDAQQALAQVRDALADRPSAGPWVATLRDLGTFQVATVDNFGVYSRHPDHGGNAAGFPEHDAAYIAKCNPENIAAILAHVEAQEAENERLTAERNALRDDNAKLNGWMEEEAQAAGRLQRKLNAAEEEIERLTDENGRLRADLLAGRNVVNAGLTIHTLTAVRDEARQRAEYWKAEHLAGNKEIDELRRQLAEAELDAQRYRWLRSNREFCVAAYPEGEWVIPAGMVFLGYSNPDADSWIDAAMGLTRPAEE